MPTKFQGYGKLKNLEDIRINGMEIPYVTDKMIPYFGDVISGEFQTSDSVETIRIDQPNIDVCFYWNKKWFEWIKDENGNLLRGELTKLTKDDHSKEIQDMIEEITEDL